MAISTPKLPPSIRPAKTPQLATAWYFFNIIFSGCMLGLLYAFLQYEEQTAISPLPASLALSGLCFSLTFCLIIWLGPSFKRRELKGVDMAKREKRELPECMGLVAAGVYLFAMLVFIPCCFYEYLVITGGGGNRDYEVEIDGQIGLRFPHNKLAQYLSTLLTLQLTIFLGLLDDLFDIRWRHKLFIPLIASIPLLIVYRVDFNVTSILLPESLASYLNISPLIDLGSLYYVYMSILLIFCPNSINILAGVNGIEVGQSLVIGAALIANDLLYIRHPQHPAAPSHLFSIYFLLPFMGVSLALFFHNKYPAKVFVGDTYCYFAGMIFASVAVTGHFSKTLMTLFVPQVFNFIFSAPQLFHIVPCPRHRLPRYDPVSDCQYASTMTFTTPPKGLAKLILKVFEGLKFVKLTYDKDGKNILASTNFTLINMWILWVGEKDENGDRRIREGRLCWSLMGLQAVCCAVGLGARHLFARAVFGRDNLGTGIW